MHFLAFFLAAILHSFNCFGFFSSCRIHSHCSLLIAGSAGTFRSYLVKSYLLTALALGVALVSTPPWSCLQARANFRQAFSRQPRPRVRSSSLFSFFATLTSRRNYTSMIVEDEKGEEGSRVGGRACRIPRRHERFLLVSSLRDFKRAVRAMA